MIFDGIKLGEGSEFQNLVVDSGSAFPSTPNEGELFYRNDGANEGLYVYDGSIWNKHYNATDDLGNALPVTGIAAGTYKSVTVDTKGRVTAGSNPSTLAGYGITDGQPIDADLTAISNISATTGLLRKTASNTWSLDTSAYITGNENISVTGDVTGSGATAINLALTTTGVAAGSYGNATSSPTLVIDSKGRVTSASNTTIALDTSAVTSGTFANPRISQSSVTQHQAALTVAESQITDGAILARVNSNESISGSWTFNTTVTGQTPTASGHLTTKDYVDNIAAGVVPQKSVKVATTANITLSGTQTVDGVSVIAGDRVLVKDQASAPTNGIYVVAAGAWSRATDFDGNPNAEVQTGSLIYVESGTANGNSSWILITAGTVTVGSTGLSFTIFSRAGDFVAGTGLTKTGNTFDVGTASSSRIVVNADNIDLATTGVTSGTFTKVTVDVYGRVTTGAQVVAGDIPTLNQNTTGTAANVTGVVAIANGGTGQTTAEAAIDALGGSAINPVTPKDGDIRIVGSVISVYASGAYRQVFPAVYS